MFQFEKKFLGFTPRTHTQQGISPSRAHVHPAVMRCICRHLHALTSNSSGDEIANVNFLYDDIVHALQNTIYSCINSATDWCGYVLKTAMNISCLQARNDSTAVAMWPHSHSVNEYHIIIVLLLTSLHHKWCLSDVGSAYLTVKHHILYDCSQDCSHKLGQEITQPVWWPLFCQRCGTICLNRFGNQTSPSDNSNLPLDNSNYCWKRLCLVSSATAPCVWMLRALSRNLLTYLLTVRLRARLHVTSLVSSITLHHITIVTWCTLIYKIKHGSCGRTAGRTTT